MLPDILLRAIQDGNQDSCLDYWTCKMVHIVQKDENVHDFENGCREIYNLLK